MFVRFKNVRNDTIVAIFLPMQGILNALIQSNARQVVTKLICRCCKKDASNESSHRGARFRFLLKGRRSTKDTQQPSEIVSNEVNDAGDSVILESGAEVEEG